MYEHITPESIEESILEAITQFDTREGSFARTLIAPAAYEIWKGYTAVEGIPDMILINENSGEYIDKKAADFGIIRKEGVKASAQITLYGQPGTVAPAGKVFLTEDGLEYILDLQLVIPLEGTVSGTLTAQNEGTVYNVSAGAISVQQSPLFGMTSFACGAASGGVDRETDRQLTERYYDFIRKPATSGNVYQYEQWAKSVPGVGKVKVFPLWAGNGTVKVVLSDPDCNVASEDTVEACENYIESVRPIGATVTVESATALAVTIAASITTDMTVTKEEVRLTFVQSVQDYFQQLTFEKKEIIYNRILFLLLDIPGVQDVSALTVNGGTANLSIDDTEIPLLQEVTIT